MTKLIPAFLNFLNTSKIHRNTFCEYNLQFCHIKYVKQQLGLTHLVAGLVRVVDTLICHKVNKNTGFSLD